MLHVKWGFCFPLYVLLTTVHFMRFLFIFFSYFPTSQYIPRRAYSSAGYWLMVLLCVPFNFAINQQEVETTNLKRIGLFIWINLLERQAVLVISVWSLGGQEESMRRNAMLSTTRKKRACLSSHSKAAGHLFSEMIPSQPLMGAGSLL